MHAVIRTGGKQYRVAEGDVLRVEKLEAESGSKVELDEVLMVADGDEVRIGSPLVEGGKVTAEVQGHGRGDKIDVIKFKRRKKYRRKYGHRQDYTELKVTGISTGGKAAPKKSAAKTEMAESAGEAEAAPKKETAAGEKKTAAKKSSGTAKKSASAGTAKKAAPKKTATKKADADKAESKAKKDDGAE